MRLILFLLACYGVTNIITVSRLFEPLREWVKRRSEPWGRWIRCPMCIGVPVGLGWCLAGLSPGSNLGRLGDPLAAAAISSGWCWTVHVVLHKLGADQL